MDNLSTQPTVCRSCSNYVKESDQFCQNCGYPLKGEAAAQDQFIYNRDYQAIQLGELKRKIKNAGTTLYVIAGLSLLIGFVYMAITGDKEIGMAIMIQQVVISAVFFGLAIWSKTKPVAAIVSGLVLYGLYQILTIIEDPTNIIKGIIIKVIIIVYLVKGLQSALAAEKIRKEFNIV